jgi:hypothetical protein
MVERTIWSGLSHLILKSPLLDFRYELHSAYSLYRVTTAQTRFAATNSQKSYL